MYYFNLSKCNSNKIEKHPWKHFQLTQGQKMTLETSTAHKEEIYSTPPCTTILLRNSLSKQAVLLVLKVNNLHLHFTKGMEEYISI